MSETPNDYEPRMQAPDPRKDPAFVEAARLAGISIDEYLAPSKEERESETPAKTYYKSESRCPNIVVAASDFDRLVVEKHELERELAAMTAKRDALEYALVFCRDDLHLELIERMPHPDKTWCSIVHANEALATHGKASDMKGGSHE